MASIQMEIVSEELIQPSSPTPESLKYHKLSLLDQVLLTCHIPIIFFYPNQFHSNVDPAQRSEHLKQSLSKVLTKFYPLAGRINLNSSVDCNDSGVLFIEARVRAELSQAIQNVAIAELNQYLPFEPYPAAESAVRKDIPLAVKVSFFECGGTAVGLCMSHKIADILSVVTFFKAWTATCQGETDIVLPNFDLASHHFPPMDNIPAPEWAPEEKILMKRFVFDKEKLVALKAEASSASEVKNPSRVQLVTAFIWKHIIDVTRSKSDPKNKFSAGQAVNLRSRMSTPFPPSAMGNIATLAFAVAEEDKLDFCDLVGPLRTALGKIDDEHVKELQKGVTYLDFEAEPQELSSFSSWCRLGLYEMDFGWGKPLSVCTATLPMKNTVFMMDTRSGDGLEAWISMAEDEMEMLPSQFLSLVDSDFSK